MSNVFTPCNYLLYLLLAPLMDEYNIVWYSEQHTHLASSHKRQNQLAVRSHPAGMNLNFVSKLSREGNSSEE